MPIVNKANYVECPSCRKWMHAPTTIEQALQPFPASIHPAPLHYYGNHVAICQECYERADGSNRDVVQKAVRDAVLGGVGMYKTEYVSPQQFDRGVIESSANSGAVGQAAGQGVQTEEGQRKLAEQAKPLDVPVARAKLDMPTDDEARLACHAMYGAMHTPRHLAPDDYQVSGMKAALRQFVARRNGL